MELDVGDDARRRGALVLSLPEDKRRFGEIDPSRDGGCFYPSGCFYPRRISVADDGLSRHSWGIATDINVDLPHPDMGRPPHPDVVAAFEAHGFRWGGDFLHPDNHHLEWVGDVQPLDRWPRRDHRPVSSTTTSRAE